MNDKPLTGYAIAAEMLQRSEQLKAPSSFDEPFGSAAAFNAGVWFQSAASGLWYQVKNAGGDISAVKVDGVIYKLHNTQ